MQLNLNAGPPQYAYPGDKVYFRASVDVSAESGRLGNYAWDGAVADVKWDFGDGTSAEGPVVTHIYTEPGTYTVTMEASTALHGSSKTSTSVVIMEPVDESLPMAFRAWGFESLSSAMNLRLWEERLDIFSKMGYNAVVFMEPHPYNMLAAVPGFPEAQNISDSLLKQAQDIFREFLRMAGERGIKVYILVYNIVLPESFAKAHGLHESGTAFDYRGTDTDLTRKYTAAAVKGFHDAFPELGGLIVTVGESPVHPIEFTREAVFKPLSELDTKSHTIIRDQCIYPDEMLDLAEGLRDWSPLSKVTEEQWLGYELGLRGTLFFHQTGKRTIYLLSGHACPLFNGGVRSIRALVEDARKKHAQGFVVVSGGPDYNAWLFEAAFGYYMNNANPSPEEEKAYFFNLVRDMFGNSVPIDLFLDAGNLSADILTIVRRQLYYRNWNYKAEFGLPLISFLGMPTHSSFLHHGIDRLEREREFTWWIPREERFSEDYLTVKEHVEGLDRTASAKVVTPEDTVESLYQLADKTLEIMSELRNARPEKNADIWERNLDDMEFQAYMGKFYAAKLSAAIAWQRWVQDLISSQEAMELVGIGLNESLVYYRTAMEIYERHNGRNAPGRLLIATQNTQPPWGVEQNFHGEVEGGMRELLEIFETEVKRVISQIERNNKNLPTFRDISR